MNRSGEDVKTLRQTLRLKQRELAAICSIRTQQMCRIEKGAAKVPGYVDTILALMERDETAVGFALKRAGLR